MHSPRSSMLCVSLKYLTADKQLGIVINCSKRKLVAIILAPWSFLNVILRLTDFSSDPFNCRPRKRYKQVKPGTH